MKGKRVEGRFQGMTFQEIHNRNALVHPHEPALVFGDKVSTFGAFNERINRLTNALKDMGVKKGDRLAILSNEAPQYLEIFGVAEKYGRVAVPLNYRLKTEHLSALIMNVQPKALFVQERYIEVVDSIRRQLRPVRHFICIDGRVDRYDEYERLIREYPPSEPEERVFDDDPLFIIYTSGTTGRPKGALYTHRQQVINIYNITLELGIRPEDIYLSSMPLFHVGGKTVSLAFFSRGCTLVLLPRYDRRLALEAIEKQRVTCTHLVPTMINDLMEEDLTRYDLTSIRLILYAASPMPKSVLKRAIGKFGNVFVQMYGQTESGPTLTVLEREKHVGSKLNSCGRPIINTALKVVGPDGRDLPAGEVGEIAAKGGQIMSGYWRNPRATSKAIRSGWLYTGDMGRMDEDGYFYIVDRKDDMIISGGENIYPSEVEEVIYAHPAVREAAVIGAPDEKWVEAVRAYVVLKEDVPKVTEEEIIKHCKKYLASYKKPRIVTFVHSLPKSPAGKILRRELKTRTS